MKFSRTKCIGGGKSGIKIKILDNGWKLFDTSEKDEILDIEVPGNVRVALMNAGIIQDPFIGMNNEKSKWVPKREWTYKNRIDISEWKKYIENNLPNGGIIHLTFDAIDYDAVFFVNNQPVYRQTGMFSPVDIISAFPQENGSHELGDNNENEIELKVNFKVQPWWRTHSVKCQMAFGWDFAPEIRTIGIWKPVRIACTGNAFFTDVKARALEKDKKDSSDNVNSFDSIHLKFQLAILNPGTLLPKTKEKHPFKVRILFNNKKRDFEVEARHGEFINLKIDDANIPAWNPWALGKPITVPFKLQLYQGETLLDEFQGKILNRKIEWVRNPGSWKNNEKWTFKINGKKLFLRGINWVPPDSLFGRISRKKYEKLIDAAINMNVDMFRIWGGGIEEHESFYDYCDEKGMLLWQEFPFACTNYPKDPRYIKIARKECFSIAKNTGFHPSVVVFCGGNEFNPYINAHLVQIARDAVKKHAPDRYCFAASPFLGDDHNWRVWGQRRMYNAYDTINSSIFQMLTEFGMQAAPSNATISKIVGKDHDGNVASIQDELLYHKADLNGLKYYAKKFSKNIDDVNSLIKTSQVIQALALKYAVEACRAQWPNVSGVFPWQFSDPWPNVSWSVIDYYLNPKISYQVLKKAYSPILPFMRYNLQKFLGKSDTIKGRLIVHNISHQDIKGTLHVTIQFGKKSIKGESNKNVHEESFKIHVSPDKPLLVKTFKIQHHPKTIIKMRIVDENNQVISKNFSIPALELPESTTSKIKDTFEIWFDRGWRKYMIKLMEMERIREELKEWNVKKKQNEMN
ncbi:MAG: glycosyl hydrolase 2 galactose-binding domain-containing protein [Promethearchaeota archaeon]